MAFDRITAEPGRLEGKPCIRGLRISVETVVRLVAAGWSFTEIVDEYPDLEPEDIEQALEYYVALDAAAGVLAAVARHDRELLADLVPAPLPWTRFLPAADRELMTEEIVATAEAAASADTLAPLAQVITEWKHTAKIHADPDLHQALTRTDLDDHGPVPLPISEPR